jgi:hypothetical protein
LSNINTALVKKSIDIADTGRKIAIGNQITANQIALQGNMKRRKFIARIKSCELHQEESNR